ncbi:holin [Streptomyces halobius]|uniref:Holin n=1 Tax=Streptomyces halobius TaxID=2879846 RepID=A0ABY4MGQ0_9ACTN|nr:holin [Streptomyces halobius]UQA95590.1 holin [Streptomyces halobius]
MANAPVEKKVTAASAAAYLGSTGLLGILAAVQDNARLLEWMPDTLSPFILAIVPTLITFATGWQAKHTPRTSDGVEPTEG